MFLSLLEFARLLACCPGCKVREFTDPGAFVCAEPSSSGCALLVSGVRRDPFISVLASRLAQVRTTPQAPKLHRQHLCTNTTGRAKPGKNSSQEDLLAGASKTHETEGQSLGHRQLSANSCMSCKGRGRRTPKTMPKFGCHFWTSDLPLPI